MAKTKEVTTKGKTIPQVDEKRLEVVQKEVTTTSDKIIGLSIKDDKDMELATELLSRANKHADTIKADKEKLTKPLNAVLKAIREKYKPAETKLEKAISHLRKEIGAYQTKKDEKVEADRIKVASRVGSGRGKLTMETAGKQIEAIGATGKKVQAESGSVSFKTDYEITVVDIRKIPEQFLEVDTVAIAKVFKAGGEVAGVTGKKIKVPINRRS